jgi:hypothetical protein
MDLIFYFLYKKLFTQIKKKYNYFFNLCVFTFERVFKLLHIISFFAKQN